MKRILGLLLFALSAPCFAADNIKMVTYFPVPYLAYNELGVVGTCDLGLLGNCSLNAGKYLSVRPDTSLAQSGLNYGLLALKGGALDLQSTALTPHARSYVLRVGSYPASKTQAALLTFRHRLEVLNLEGGDLQSIEADNTAYMAGLTLFGSPFPTCNKGDHRISWQRLTFDNKESTFLVCGAGELACSDQYGPRISSSSAILDDCDGNNSSAFSCSGEAKTCKDVLGTSTKISGYTATYGAATIYASTKNPPNPTEDTCNNNIFAMFSSCSSEGSCIDIYWNDSSDVKCNCGGSTGEISCREIDNKDTFCTDYPGGSGCYNGTQYTCPAYKKRKVTCKAKYATTYEYREVTCCGKSS